MPSPLVLVPTADGAIEAARLIDAAGTSIVSVLELTATADPGEFGDPSSKPPSNAGRWPASSSPPVGAAAG